MLALCAALLSPLAASDHVLLVKSECMPHFLSRLLVATHALDSQLQVLRPRPFLPRVPFKAHPDAQAQPESTLGHTSRAILPGAPLATPAPSHPCSAAADPAQHEVQTEGGPISFASSSSKESAELQSFSFPAQAPVSPHTALQAAGWQQMPPGSLVPFTIRSPRQQNSVQQQASSRSQPSLSAEGPPRVPSSALRDRDVQSRSSSHAYTRPHARSTSAPRRRHENLRERWPPHHL